MLWSLPSAPRPRNRAIRRHGERDGVRSRCVGDERNRSDRTVTMRWAVMPGIRAGVPPPGWSAGLHRMAAGLFAPPRSGVARDMYGRLARTGVNLLGAGSAALFRTGHHGVLPASHRLVGAPFFPEAGIARPAGQVVRLGGGQPGHGDPRTVRRGPPSGLCGLPADSAWIRTPGGIRAERCHCGPGCLLQRRARDLRGARAGSTLAYGGSP
jgi:hypothetical protein